MEQKSAQMTIRDGPADDSETSAAEVGQDAELSAELPGPWEPLLAMKEVMEAILVNLQQNKRAIQAVRDAVGDLGALFGSSHAHRGMTELRNSRYRYSATTEQGWQTQSAAPSKPEA